MKHRIFPIICLVGLLLSGYGIPSVPLAYAADIIAASGSAADIQAAADTVYAAGGGSVYLPEGDFNLGGSVLIRDNVNLIGAGMDKTILRTEGESMLIEAEGDNIRISGFSLISTNSDGEDGILIANDATNCVDFQVDNCYIEGYYHAGIYVRGIDTRGVIDHCEIKMIITDTYGYGVYVSRNEFWEEDMRLGTEQATFIEDCVFVNARHAVASGYGGHYVFRHNLVKQGVVGHQVDAHGPYWGSTEGTRCIEVYENVIEDPVSGTEESIAIRGGGGVIFNNTITGYDYAISLKIEDGQDLSSYPVYHQVHDMYIWNNTHDGLAEVQVTNSHMADVYIQENRDYFLYAKPDYTPYLYPHPLTVNSPPVLDPIEDKSVKEGHLLEFAISATDPDGDLLTYSANLTTLPSGASFDSANQTFSWTPAYGEAGTYPDVRFKVTDGELTDSENITITVTENSPPVLDPIGDRSVKEGHLLEFTVSATDPDVDPLTYSANLTTLPSGAIFDSANQTFSWTPAYGEAGTYPDVQFKVTDGELTDSENITITVTENKPPVLDPIGDRSVKEGQLLEFTVSAADPDSDPLTYSANLTTLPPEASFDPATQSFSWTPASGQAETYPDVRFEVTDGELSDSENITITVSTSAASHSTSVVSGGSSSGGGATGNTNLYGSITGSGRFMEDVIAKSVDRQVELSIPVNTIGKNRVGQPLYYLSIREKRPLPVPPADSQIIGSVYEIGPTGASFDPSIDLNFKYDESELPEGVAEENLVISTYNRGTKQWQELESVADPDSNTMTAKVSHLSTFAVLARTRSASFEVTDLSVPSEDVDCGETVSINILITNNGNLTGTYDISLKINDVVVQTREVTLDGSDSQIVSFNVTMDTVGDNIVSISDLSDTFHVRTLETLPAPAPELEFEPAPASFVISDLSVVPSQVRPSEQVTISALITNIGGSKGSYTALLKIDGEKEASKEVTIGTGKSKTVTFTIAKDIVGSYTVDIGGSVSQFTIAAPRPPIPKSTEALPVSPPAKWGLIVGIIAGCVVVIGLLAYFFWWRKQKARII